MYGSERLMTVSALMVSLGWYSVASAQVHEAWAAPYDGPGGGVDMAADLAVDGAGNIYVTGGSENSGPGWNAYTTIKYDASGSQLWERRYDGPGGSWDAASAMAVDDAGNVYVTGTSRSGPDSWDNDYATVKYDTDGNELWVRRYDGPANSWDDAYAIAIDGAGNCFVTGVSNASVSSYDFDIATIKYDPAGNQLWVRRYDGPGGFNNSGDAGKALAVDGLGNVHVTGFSGGVGLTAEDMVTLKYDPAGNELWAAHFDSAYNQTDIGNDLALDGAGNVYVAGQSSPWDWDYTTVKYDSNGVQQWARTYDGGGTEDYPGALVVVPTGNVVVTGGSSGMGASIGATTVMYDPAGTELWVSTFQDPAYIGSSGVAIAAGASGVIYVAGNAKAGVHDHDYLTIKYDPLGSELWTALHPGPSDQWDFIKALALDAAENVYVTGSQTSASEDYLTIKYVQELGGEYCFGDGSATPCPCSNPGGVGEGCTHSGGSGGRVAVAGSSSASADDLASYASCLLPGQPALLFAGENAVNGGQGVALGDGLRCAGMHVVRLGTRTPDANGDASWGPGLGAAGGWDAGDTLYFQTWYRDPSGPCGTGFNLTNGVELTLAP